MSNIFNYCPNDGFPMHIKPRSSKPRLVCSEKNSTFISDKNIFCNPDKVRKRDLIICPKCNLSQDYEHPDTSWYRNTLISLHKLMLCGSVKKYLSAEIIYGDLLIGMEEDVDNNNIYKEQAAIKTLLEQLNIRVGEVILYQVNKKIGRPITPKVKMHIEIIKRAYPDMNKSLLGFIIDLYRHSELSFN